MRTTVREVRFDPELIARYDTAAPRYTSYPTAPHFTTRFNAAHYRAMAMASNRQKPATPLSLYLHIPFCWSPCFYCGCNRIITHDKGRSGQYLQALGREMSKLAPLFDDDRQVRQLHLGGGTPNFLDIGQLDELLRVMRTHFAFATDRRGVEAGIEVDPRFADFDYVIRLGGIGFNRISIGLQDFDPKVQKAVNRIQTVEQTAAVLNGARAAGFHSINVDLIYGLPKQTPEGFSRTLDQVVALAPDRLAVYGYAHLPQLFKAQRQIADEDLPGPATRLALFGLALEKLQAAGYLYVGMDHFARAGDELVRAQDEGTLQRNFQGYSTLGQCDIVGLGMSAISRVGTSYSQNVRDLPGYYLALEHADLPIQRGITLGPDDVIRRDAISELMCHGHLDLERFGARHGIRTAEYFAPELTRLLALQADGLVELRPDAVSVTACGRLLMRNIAMQFDAYITRSDQAMPPHYSRAI